MTTPSFLSRDTPLRIEPAGWFGRNNGWYLVRSAGPDRKFNTADDLTVWLEPQGRTASTWDGSTQWEDTITMRMEHDH
ncbi:MAG TPA: hypothetical protein VJQ82_07495, partial [Terriglobales bacterium]|nr:hypothetical protein [Terriglobales bacterium]